MCLLVWVWYFYILYYVVVIQKCFLPVWFFEGICYGWVFNVGEIPTFVFVQPSVRKMERVSM